VSAQSCVLPGPLASPTSRLGWVAFRQRLPRQIRPGSPKATAARRIGAAAGAAGRPRDVPPERKAGGAKPMRQSETAARATAATALIKTGDFRLRSDFMSDSSWIGAAQDVPLRHSASSARWAGGLGRRSLSRKVARRRGVLKPHWRPVRGSSRMTRGDGCRAPDPPSDQTQSR